MEEPEPEMHEAESAGCSELAVVDSLLLSTLVVLVLPATMGVASSLSNETRADNKSERCCWFMPE